MAMVGIQDEFGQVGTQGWLQQYYRLTAEEITRKALALVKSKKE
jgi:transketolase